MNIKARKSIITVRREISESFPGTPRDPNLRYDRTHRMEDLLIDTMETLDWVKEEIRASNDEEVIANRYRLLADCALQRMRLDALMKKVRKQ